MIQCKDDDMSECKEEHMNKSEAHAYMHYKASCMKSIAQFQAQEPQLPSRCNHVEQLDIHFHVMYNVKFGKTLASCQVAVSGRVQVCLPNTPTKPP